MPHRALLFLATVLLLVSPCIPRGLAAHPSVTLFVQVAPQLEHLLTLQLQLYSLCTGEHDALSRVLLSSLSPRSWRDHQQDLHTDPRLGGAHQPPIDEVYLVARRASHYSGEFLVRLRRLLADYRASPHAAHCPQVHEIMHHACDGSSPSAAALSCHLTSLHSRLSEEENERGGALGGGAQLGEGDELREGERVEEGGDEAGEDQRLGEGDQLRGGGDEAGEHQQRVGETPLRKYAHAHAHEEEHEDCVVSSPSPTAPPTHLLACVASRIRSSHLLFVDGRSVLHPHALHSLHTHTHSALCGVTLSPSDHILYLSARLHPITTTSTAPTPTLPPTPATPTTTHTPHYAVLHQLAGAPSAHLMATHARALQLCDGSLFHIERELFAEYTRAIPASTSHTALFYELSLRSRPQLHPPLQAVRLLAHVHDHEPTHDHKLTQDHESTHDHELTHANPHARAITSPQHTAEQHLNRLLRREPALLADATVDHSLPATLYSMECGGGAVRGFTNEALSMLRSFSGLRAPVGAHHVGDCEPELLSSLPAYELQHLRLMQRCARDERFQPHLLLLHKDPGRYERTARAAAFSGRAADSVRYVIGRSMYESDTVPQAWLEPLRSALVDEVWVPSAFNRDSFTSAGVDPARLHVMPEPVDVHWFDPQIHTPLTLDLHVRTTLTCTPTTSTTIATPTSSSSTSTATPATATTSASASPPSVSPTTTPPFLFLSIFKFEERKNWQLLLRAFWSEFYASADTALLLRVTLTPEGCELIAELRREHLRECGAACSVELLPTVHLLESTLSSRDLPRLYASADAFVLPTHGEGWGLPIAEAMAMQLPVIATAWGGSTEFLTAENSFALPAALLCNATEPGHQWAQPLQSDLQRLLRQVRQQPDEARQRGERARRHIVQHFSVEAVTHRLEQRLRAIQENAQAEAQLDQRRPTLRDRLSTLDHQRQQPQHSNSFVWTSHSMQVQQASVPLPSRRYSEEIKMAV
jgi:glycosyltransferase involved in cell wall biosynthesis